MTGPWVLIWLGLACWLLAAWSYSIWRLSLKLQPYYPIPHLRVTSAVIFSLGALLMMSAFVAWVWPHQP